MIANFLRRPGSPGEWAADVVRVAGVLSVVVCFVWFAPTDAGVIALTTPALMLPRFLGVVAWFDVLFGLTVLVAAWSNVIDLYTSVWWWDIAVHLVCTAVLAVMAYVLLARLGVLPGARRPARVPIVLVTALGLALSAVWEMVEWAGFVFVTDEIFVAYQDTIGDMAVGGLGALGAGIALRYVAVERPESSDANRSSGGG
jgi:hypothetical protein